MTASAQRPSSITDAPLAAAACSLVADGRVLLAPTTFTVRRGIVTAVVGHNGSGKSTLLKLLARQIEPTSGAITLAGRPAADFGARAFARRVAYLPQHLPDATGMTGRELVAMGRFAWHGPFGRLGPEGLAAVTEALRLSDTTPFADRLADTLSGGERQRLWIAMLLAQQSGTLLLDEPLAALDLGHQVEVMTLLRQLSRTRNAGVVLVVHDINIAARYCDRIVALRAGAVVADGAPAAIMQAAKLEVIFGLPMRVLADHATPVAVPA